MKLLDTFSKVATRSIFLIAIMFFLAPSNSSRVWVRNKKELSELKKAGGLSIKELTLHELNVGRARVVKSIVEIAQKKDTIIIAQSQPKKSFMWMAREIDFVTKPYSIKPKSAPDTSPLGGLIPVNQKYSKLKGKITKIKHYQKIVNNLLKNNEARKTFVRMNGKIIVVNQRNDIVWLNEKDLNQNYVPVEVLTDVEGRIYVSDVDMVLVASKINTKKDYDQSATSPIYGVHSPAHIKIAKKVNKIFGQGLINHSACHSWEEEGSYCGLSYPLLAYDKDGVTVIKKGPEGDKNRYLWQYLLKKDQEGYAIRPHPSWQKPADKESVRRLFAN